jgi:hypothetical protein
MWLKFVFVGGAWGLKKEAGRECCTYHTLGRGSFRKRLDVGKIVLSRHVPEVAPGVAPRAAYVIGRDFEAEGRMPVGIFPLS